MVNLFLDEEKEGERIPAYIATISQSATTRITGLATSHTTGNYEHTSLHRHHLTVSYH
jgi:hypothetical protein